MSGVCYKWKDGKTVKVKVRDPKVQCTQPNNTNVSLHIGVIKQGKYWNKLA